MALRVVVDNRNLIFLAYNNVKHTLIFSIPENVRNALLDLAKRGSNIATDIGECEEYYDDNEDVMLLGEQLIISEIVNGEKKIVGVLEPDQFITANRFEELYGGGYGMV